MDHGFNQGVPTLDRLMELTREVDFAAFVFAQDDRTSNPSDPGATGAGGSGRIIGLIVVRVCLTSVRVTVSRLSGGVR